MSNITLIFICLVSLTFRINSRLMRHLIQLEYNSVIFFWWKELNLLDDAMLRQRHINIASISVAASACCSMQHSASSSALVASACDTSPVDGAWRQSRHHFGSHCHAQSVLGGNFPLLLRIQESVDQVDSVLDWKIHFFRLKTGTVTATVFSKTIKFLMFFPPWFVNPYALFGNPFSV